MSFAGPGQAHACAGVGLPCELVWAYRRGMGAPGLCGPTAAAAVTYTSPASMSSTRPSPSAAVVAAVAATAAAAVAPVGSLGVSGAAPASAATAARYGRQTR